MQNDIRELGGRLLHVTEQAGAGPPVVLLGGCGVPLQAWTDVAFGLAGRHVFRVSRPGLGTPWPGTMPTLGEEVATLVDLLAELPPAVLVAHSMAGPHVEALARLHPDSIGGLVLVDASVEWELRPERSERFWLGCAGVALRLFSVPPLGLLGSLMDRVITSVQSQRLHWYDHRSAAELATYRSAEATASVIAEQAAYEAQLHVLAALRESHPFPEVPVAVLSAGLGGGLDWIVAQAKLATMLRAEHTVVTDSRHMMMVDRPDVIVAAVASVAELVGG
jgi:poly(3-hydroxyoctanoate) depolymerase